MAKDYVSSDTARLDYIDRDGKQRRMELLWGDQVEVVADDGTTATVKARDKEGTVKSASLGGEALLEVYFIDVGQGDGVLIVTPDAPKRRHVLIDGGYIRERQPTGKNAADFVDWKFAKDYRRRRIELDALIASHCDSDHYGGLWDLVRTDAAARRELGAEGVDVDLLYHAGVSWWVGSNGKRGLGDVEEIDGTDYLTWVLQDADVADALDDTTPGRRLQGEWKKFLQAASDHGCAIRRLSHVDAYLPGFEPSDDDDDGVASIRILAPIEYDDGDGNPVYRAYTRSSSQNTNGHSLLLRLDYGRSRILLTGDLNKRSMQAILEDVPAAELACDVAKGCHHGSDDVSYRFLQAMGAAATVISSGDNEQHAHPRPTIVAASAQAGHVHIHDDEMKTPLVYSTEVSRSIAVGKLTGIRDTVEHAGEDVSITLEPQRRKAGAATLDYEVVMAGDLNPKKTSRAFYDWTRVVDAVTYGLVNVRTDGRKILCATLNEKKDKWEVETFESRF